MTTKPEFVAALVLLARAAEECSGRARWTVEAQAARADVFVVLDDPRLAARIKAVMAEGHVEHVEPTECFAARMPA